MDGIDKAKLSDRELLLLIQERQAVMGLDVKELKDGTQKELATLGARVESLKDTKADKSALERLERGQNRLFNYIWAAFGALAILQFTIPLVLKAMGI